MPSCRNNDKAESYSTKFGVYFRIYSSSGRKQPDDFVEDSQQKESMECPENSVHEASGW
jgi:hypothetical protein